MLIGNRSKDDMSVHYVWSYRELTGDAYWGICFEGWVKRLWGVLGRYSTTKKKKTFYVNSPEYFEHDSYQISLMEVALITSAASYKSKMHI